MRNQVKEQTRNLPVKQVFITHYHEDHTGNIEELREQHGCNVFASELCCEIMKDPPRISFLQRQVWGDRDPDQHLISKSGFIETNNYRFEIIPVPGHAADMVALYERSKGWLFSADVYVNARIDYMLEEESIGEQIQSIKKILKLDFEQMFCCHKPRLENGRDFLQKKLEFSRTVLWRSLIPAHAGMFNSRDFFKNGFEGRQAG